MIELIKEIREILAIVIPFSIGIIVLLSKLTKNKKLRALSENLIQIDKVIKDYMCDAESFLNYSGPDKKEWVKTKVNQFCIENKIPYKKDTVDNTIETLIGLSKTVNKREKDMEELK